VVERGWWGHCGNGRRWESLFRDALIRRDIVERGCTDSNITLISANCHESEDIIYLSSLVLDDKRVGQLEYRERRNYRKNELPFSK
jgi:hypothetical protein